MCIFFLTNSRSRYSVSSVFFRGMLDGTKSVRTASCLARAHMSSMALPTRRHDVHRRPSEILTRSAPCSSRTRSRAFSILSSMLTEHRSVATFWFCGVKLLHVGGRKETVMSDKGIVFLRNLAIFICAAILFGSSCHAQSVFAYAAFGSLYTWSSNTTTVTVPVNDTQWIRGSFYGGGSLNTSVGTVSSYLNGYFLNGEGQELLLPVTFTSNGDSGSISGTLTVTFTCSSDCTQNSLTVYIYPSGDSTVASATASPKYFLASLLYDPPGDGSSSGFSNSVSAGTSTSLSQDFSNNVSLTFGGGFLGANSSVTFGSGQSYGDSSSFTTTYQAASGAQLNSHEQAIDHTQDEFFLLVDPSFSLQQTGAASATYYIGPSVDATGNFGSGGVPPDFINMNVAGLKAPTSIPLSYLEPQVTTPGTTLPGLSFICANPLPPSQCTSQNACGCTSADFAGIVSQDSLANVTDQTIAPSSIDSARYLYLTYQTLDGPTQSGGGTVTHQYSISDSSQNGYSTSNGTSYSVGYSHKWEVTSLFSLNITAQDTFTYSQTQTFGTTNGQAHTANLSLGSDKVGCHESVDIYEDATYHTFAFALPQAPPSECQ